MAQSVLLKTIGSTDAGRSYPVPSMAARRRPAPRSKSEDLKRVEVARLEVSGDVSFMMFKETA